MNQKKLLNLALIFFIGVVLLIARNYWQQWQQKQPNQYLQTISKFNSDKTNSITIETKSVKLELTKQDNTWKIASQSADKAKVEELIKAFFPKNSPILLAESKEQLENFATTADYGKTVTLKNLDNQELTFFVGKENETNTGVAIKDQNKAYGIRNFPIIYLEPSQWYDLTISQIPPVNIEKIVYEKNQQNFSVIKNDQNEWNFEGEELKTNSDAVAEFSKKFDNFNAQEIAFEKKLTEFNLNLPQFIITVKEKGGNETRLEFFQGNFDWLVKVQDKYFVIAKTDAEKFNITKDKFIMAE
ncbi:DUF4340 domain-containing protein [Candidatus Beckwithbacteria bacterium]|nr:DUF4340 domain-containing protein [Candidatus Beckwithbacteria bacterium]